MTAKRKPPRKFPGREPSIYGSGQEPSREERAANLAELRRRHTIRAERESEGHEHDCRCWACLYLLVKRRAP